MATLTLTDTERFLVNQEGQDFSHEAKTFIKIRELAIKNLKKLEFPTQKLEAWKYTNLREITKQEFTPQSAINVIGTRLKSHLIPNLDAYFLVFVNGFFVSELSQVKEDKDGDFVVTNLNKAKSKFIKLVEPHLGFLTRDKNQFFGNLNAAFSQDGAFVYVKAGKQLDKPVHVINLIDGDLVVAYPRNLIVAEKNAEANVIVSHETLETKSALNNAVNEVFVAEGAHVIIDKIQNENSNTFHIGGDFAQQQKNSTFTLNTIPVNGKLIRNNVTIDIDGEGSTANLFGAVCLKDNVHVDNQTLVNHLKPNCDSNELYKCVVNDSASSVFNGKIFVNKIAQKTNAFQSNANILLSDDSKAFSKPQLEIYADDVKCSHGCTIGQFDEEALFYLRTRGIKESTAKKVLLEAFIGEVLENLKIAPVRAHVESLIENNFTAKK